MWLGLLAKDFVVLLLLWVPAALVVGEDDGTMGVGVTVEMASVETPSSGASVSADSFGTVFKGSGTANGSGAAGAILFVFDATSGM